MVQIFQLADWKFEFSTFWDVSKKLAVCYTGLMNMGSGKHFQRRKENFYCGQCGYFVEGNGYTNHCPKCLYSKHVDVFPGDRAENCQGLMKPIYLEKDRSDQKLTHRCVICGFTKKNKVNERDDFVVLLKLAQKIGVKKWKQKTK